jgi:hypothetical protein
VSADSTTTTGPPAAVVVGWDWDSTGLWHLGTPEMGIDPDCLGLSPTTREALRAWVERGSELAQSGVIGRMTPRNRTTARFVTEQERLVRLIQGEVETGHPRRRVLR